MDSGVSNSENVKMGGERGSSRAFEWGEKKNSNNKSQRYAFPVNTGCSNLNPL